MKVISTLLYIYIVSTFLLLDKMKVIMYYYDIRKRNLWWWEMKLLSSRTFSNSCFMGFSNWFFPPYFVPSWMSMTARLLGKVCDDKQITTLHYRPKLTRLVIDYVLLQGVQSQRPKLQLLSLQEKLPPKLLKIPRKGRRSPKILQNQKKKSVIMKVRIAKKSSMAVLSKVSGVEKLLIKVGENQHRKGKLGILLQLRQQILLEQMLAREEGLGSRNLHISKWKWKFCYVETKFEFEFFLFIYFHCSSVLFSSLASFLYFIYWQTVFWDYCLHYLENVWGNRVTFLRTVCTILCRELKISNYIVLPPFCQNDIIGFIKHASPRNRKQKVCMFPFFFDWALRVKCPLGS